MAEKSGKPARRAASRSLDALPVGSTAREPKRAIGEPGTAPMGVTTDGSGTRARSVAPKKEAPKRGVKNLGTAREIRIMPSVKVPFPRLGDRRALIAPGSTPIARKSRAFAIVEYAGNTCVRVHGATDDARQAQAIALTVASKVQTFIMRGAVGVAQRNGKVYGKPIKPVRVFDMTGLGLAPKKTRSKAPVKKASLPAPTGPVKSGAQVDYSDPQTVHARDIETLGKCSACDGKIKNARCEAAPVSDAVKALRAERAEIEAREAEAARTREYESLKAMRAEMRADA